MSERERADRPRPYLVRSGVEKRAIDGSSGALGLELVKCWLETALKGGCPELADESEAKEG